MSRCRSITTTSTSTPAWTSCGSSSGPASPTPRRATSPSTSSTPATTIGDGLIRHCTFRVPRYLLTGGKGQSWEWLTEVKPKESWKYNAVGRPLLSEAEGLHPARGHRRRDAPGSISPRRTTPSTRCSALLLEKRVHAFISKDNDRLIKDSLTMGVRLPARRQGQGRRQGPLEAPGRTTEHRRDGRRPLGQRAHRQGRRGLPGPGRQRGHPRAARRRPLGRRPRCSSCSSPWTTCGVDVGVVAAGISADETGRLLDRGGRPPRPPARRARRSTAPTARCASARACAPSPRTPPSRWCASRRSCTSTRSTTSSTTPSTPPAPSSASPSRSTSGSPAPGCARPASIPSCSRTCSSTSRG